MSFFKSLFSTNRDDKNNYYLRADRLYQSNKEVGINDICESIEEVYMCRVLDGGKDPSDFPKEELQKWSDRILEKGGVYSAQEIMILDFVGRCPLLSSEEYLSLSIQDNSFWALNKAISLRQFDEQSLEVLINACSEEVTGAEELLANYKDSGKLETLWAQKKLVEASLYNTLFYNYCEDSYEELKVTVIEELIKTKPYISWSILFAHMFDSEETYELISPVLEEIILLSKHISTTTGGDKFQNSSKYAFNEQEAAKMLEEVILHEDFSSFGTDLIKKCADVILLNESFWNIDTVEIAKNLKG